MEVRQILCTVSRIFIKFYSHYLEIMVLFSGGCHGYLAFIVCLYSTNFVYRTLFFRERMDARHDFVVVMQQL